MIDLDSMSDDDKLAALESIHKSIAESKEVQKQKIAANVNLVLQALKKMEADIRARYDETGKAIEKRVASIKDGQDGRDGIDGKNGKDGRNGKDGAKGDKGDRGLDGRDGIDGVDGVSVTDAHIDFDGSLIISLSSGRTINVGEVIAPDVAEKIKVITNGGGTSQTVIDALASLQTQINNIYPSQTGNAGKFLTTNGTMVSWASVAGGLSYQGTWNASTNTPTLASGVGVNGYYYIVATAGSTNLDGITDWQIGDWLMFNGTVWQKIDQSNLVTSVNGQTGAVSLTTTNINEGTNLYYTDTRARASVSAGTGISYSSATGVITNSAPDQTVSLTAGTGINTSGTYPSFTITNSAPDQTVVLTAGTGISTSGTYPSFTITNSAPDQTVALTGAGTTAVTGTYPNFTITSNDQYVGTVTSVGGTGTVNGISLSGTVTSSGNLTLGGTLSGVDLTTQVTGTLPIANGGTGQTTANTAFNALAPSQTGNSGEYLTTDGTNTSWAPVVAGASISNDTSTATNVYPLFAAATSGTPTTIYTSNAKLLYKPSTGELSATVPRASNGIFVNTQAIAADYTIAATDNGMSAGPVSVNSGITVTVSSGSTWTVV